MMRPLRQHGQLYEELINIPRCVNKNNNQWAAPLSASMGTATLWTRCYNFVIRDLVRELYLVCCFCHDKLCIFVDDLGMSNGCFLYH